MALNFKDVAEILKIVDASDCEEVILEVEGIRLVVRRGGGGGNKDSKPPPEITKKAEETAVLPLADPQPADPQPADPQPASNKGEASGSAAEVAEGHVGVRAPMVGTAYLRPAPDEPRFVDVGTRVEKGAPLCLIEVMKLYTTIEAPAAGVIAAIHMDDGRLVEFDQLLFAIASE